MKLTVFIIITIFTCAVISCDFGDKKLVVHNASMDTLFFTVFGNDPITEMNKSYYYRTKEHKNWNEHCFSL